MIDERERLKVIINHLDSAYSKVIRSHDTEEQEELQMEWWSVRNRLVGDDCETWYDYVLWLCNQIEERKRGVD